MKRFLHNKQKLRLTHNLLPSAACRCHASDHPSNSNLLTFQSVLVSHQITIFCGIKTPRSACESLKSATKELQDIIGHFNLWLAQGVS